MKILFSGIIFTSQVSLTSSHWTFSNNKVSRIVSKQLFKLHSLRVNHYHY